MKGIERDGSFADFSNFQYKSPGDDRTFQNMCKERSHGIYLDFARVSMTFPIIKDMSETLNRRLFVKNCPKSQKLVKLFRKVNSFCKVVIGTNPPKALRSSIANCPHKSTLAVADISKQNQYDYEHFVTKINEQYN